MDPQQQNNPDTTQESVEEQPGVASTGEAFETGPTGEGAETGGGSGADEGTESGNVGASGDESEQEVSGDPAED